MKITELGRKYCSEFPNTPSRTLARKLVKEHPVFGLERARSIIRNIRGRNGKANRQQYKKIDGRFYIPPKKILWNSTNPFSLPEPDKIENQDYKLPITQGRILLLYDGHMPYQENEPINLALEYGYKQGTDLIYLGGDWMDCYSISNFCKDPERRNAAEEIEILKEFFTILRGSFPKAKIIYKVGNHEDRWRKWWWQNAEVLGNVKSRDLKNELELEKYGIDWVESNQFVVHRELTILHGHEVLKGASIPVNPARSAFLKCKDIVIIGHCHQESRHTVRTIRNKLITCWSVGCLCNLTPEYRPVNEWCHGFAYAVLDDDGTWRIDNKRIYKNKIF